MKILPFILFSLLLVGFTVSRSDRITSYTVYAGYSSGSYTMSAVTGSTQYRIGDLVSGRTDTIYVVVTASDNHGMESEYSNEVSGISANDSLLTWSSPTLYDDGSRIGSQKGILNVRTGAKIKIR